MHGPPSGPEEPASQRKSTGARHVVLPGGKLESNGHKSHVEIAEAPIAVEYFPTPQSLQLFDPAVSLYFPATHAVHVPPFFPDVPRLQVHEDKIELPVGAFEFAGHARHTPDPIDCLYFPATHARHVEPIRHTVLWPTRKEYGQLTNPPSPPWVTSPWARQTRSAVCK